VCNQRQGRVRPNGEVQETLPLFPRLSFPPLYTHLCQAGSADLPRRSQHRPPTNQLEHVPSCRAIFGEPSSPNSVQGT
jgi:hypothetical protein